LIIPRSLASALLFPTLYTSFFAFIQIFNLAMSEANHKESLRPLSMVDSEKTATQSVNQSMGDTKELDESTMPPTTPSVRGEKALETNMAPIGSHSTTDEQVPHAAEKSTPEEEVDDDFEYPKAWRLGAITVALCLSIFCMALVGTASVQTITHPEHAC
jgi:hypothetical protein